MKVGRKASTKIPAALPGRHPPGSSRRSAEGYHRRLADMTRRSRWGCIMNAPDGIPQRLAVVIGGLTRATRTLTAAVSELDRIGEGLKSDRSVAVNLGRIRRRRAAASVPRRCHSSRNGVPVADGRDFVRLRHPGRSVRRAGCSLSRPRPGGIMSARDSFTQYRASIMAILPYPIAKMDAVEAGAVEETIRCGWRCGFEPGLVRDLVTRPDGGGASCRRASQASA